MISRRSFTTGALTLGALPLLSPVVSAAVEIGDNGLHLQDWFLDSFLDLNDDLATAADEGRHLAVIFEQRGCPYCRQMHEVNLEDARVTDYLQQHFDILQLDLRGSRAVTDFDGEEMEERELARRWRVNFTPTIIFFPADPAAVAGKNGRAAEIARMPGYFRPLPFLSMFEYIAEGHHAEQDFQRYLRDRFDSLRAAGTDPENW